MFLGCCLKYFHTLRYLKVQQMVGRVTRRFKKIDITPIAGLKPRILVRAFIPIRLNKRSMFDGGRFIFLNESGILNDWNDCQRSKLWLYNLHYFDDLNSVDASSRFSEQATLVDRWIDENPAIHGNGWEPYPVSLRIVNWIKWLLAHGEATEKQLESLGLQAKVLSQTLETHLLGNHLFANAKALLFAGLYFQGREADLWLAIALKVMRREIQEQILEDGANFELTPMYHAVITADLLDMVSIMSAYRDKRCEKLETECRLLLPKMLHWLAVMTHPDGYVSLFNDSATDIAPTLSQLVRVSKIYNVFPAHTIEAELVHQIPSGYFRLNLQEAVVIGDVGKVGPDYIPGHAHADTLSFELSAFGQRFIVNSGTSVYGTSDERLRQRGTAAHNTVIVDRQDSSEVWGGFRVARRARPFGLSCDAQKCIVRCSHDGYLRLPGKPIHTREWHYTERSLRILDRVTGNIESAQARYHLHPEWYCELVDNSLRCRRGSNVIELHVISGVAHLEPSTYHPEFGSQIENTVLVVVLSEMVAEVEICW